MYYGFDVTTKQCVWTTSYEPSKTDGIEVIYSNTTQSITDIELGKDDDGKYVIVKRELTEEEQLSQLRYLKEGLLLEASKEIDVLSDVVEFNYSKENEALLLAWRKYRAALYQIEISLDTEFPTKPTATK